MSLLFAQPDPAEEDQDAEIREHPGYIPYLGLAAGNVVLALMAPATISHWHGCRVRPQRHSG